MQGLDDAMSTLVWFLIGAAAAVAGLLALEQWASRRNEAFLRPPEWAQG
jgi:uncharacterized iron-regulated membrane protein